MKRTFFATIWIAVAGLVLVSFSQAFAGDHGRSRRAGHRTNVPDHVVAFAALDPVVDGAPGWGRFVVRDASLPSGMKRSVQVKLFGLAPEAEFAIEADGVALGSIVTDEDGDGVLKLQTDGEGHDEVPEELPAAADLETASIFDPGSMEVLHGTFSVIREHVADRLVHFEKIRLEDVNGGDARGMAAVARKESGAQAFATMATGLEPYAKYRIEADMIDAAKAEMIEVGTVVADAEGQAYLERHVPADENPLPPTLQPVDDIRIVDWYRVESHTLVLTGEFSGDEEEHCSQTQGTYAGPNGENGFLLQKGDVALEIVVTDETEFEGFDDLGELEVGDWLKVEACWDGEQLVARSVELKEPHPECRAIPGTFDGIVDGGFALRVGDPDIMVVVTDDTEFKGFENLADLEVGDKLVVFGCWDDDAFVARWVKRVGSVHEVETCEAEGRVAGLEPYGLMIETEDGMMKVIVTDRTELEGFESLDELVEGDVVLAEGLCRDGAILATRVALIKHRA